MNSGPAPYAPYYHLPAGFSMQEHAQGQKLGADRAQIQLRSISKTFKNKERYTVPDYLLFIPLAGQKVFYHGPQQLEVEAGNLLLIRAGARLSCDLTRLDEGRFEALMFQMDAAFIARVLDQYQRACPPQTAFPELGTPQDLCQITVNPLLKSSIESLLPFFMDPSAHYQMLIQLKMEELLLHLLHLPHLPRLPHPEDLERVPGQNSTDSTAVFSLLAEVCSPERNAYLELINHCLHTPLSIEQMAQRVHQSPTTFKKTFKQYFQQPPAQYLQHKRLEEAHYLLRNTTDSITDVGFACGFESTSHFIQAFKRKYNQTPGQLRKA